MLDTEIGRVSDASARFFAFARERHGIYLRRAAGKPQPWTADPILRKYRFTNVYRELDATTKWCKKYVRDPLGGKPEALLAIVLFRWFNRISTGEALFCEPNMLTKRTLFEQALATLASKGPGAMRMLLQMAIERLPPPYVTGAFIVNTAGLGTGKTKLEGVLLQFAAFAKRDWHTRAQQMATPQFNHTMQGTTAWLMESPGMGGFMAYEVACDLRYTPLLQHASDACTWANPGPGAKRGLNRVMLNSMGVDAVRASVTEKQAVADMQELLARSRQPANWPLPGMDVVHLPKEALGTVPGDWPAWEMREVEHTLCEFDKYERARLEQGRPRGVFAK